MRPPGAWRLYERSACFDISLLMLQHLLTLLIERTIVVVWPAYCFLFHSWRYRSIWYVDAGCREREVRSGQIYYSTYRPYERSRCKENYETNLRKFDNPCFDQRKSTINIIQFRLIVYQGLVRKRTEVIGSLGVCGSYTNTFIIIDSMSHQCLKYLRYFISHRRFCTVYILNVNCFS